MADGIADPVIDRLVRSLAQDLDDTSDYALNPFYRAPESRAVRPAAVLVGLKPTPAGMHVVLTKRSSKLQHHPGQVSFPGGKVEKTDADLQATALREAREEIGLDPDRVRVLGTLGPHETVTGFHITPILGLIRGDFTPRRDPSEVEEVFSVPLSHLGNPERYKVESHVWRGMNWHYLTVNWGPYYIWGATARILRGLADRLQV